LETQVERRTLATHAAGHTIAFDLRLSFGRYWLKLIAKLSNDYTSDYIGAYPVLEPNPDDILQADRCAHLESWQMFEATAGRAMDGIALFEYLTAQSTNHAYDNITTISPGDHSALDDLANRFIASVNRTISTPPTEDDAWIPEHLEYQFAACRGSRGQTRQTRARAINQGKPSWRVPRPARKGQRSNRSTL
jgi:hypothetical protein